MNFTWNSMFSPSCYVIFFKLFNILSYTIDHFRSVTSFWKSLRSSKTKIIVLLITIKFRRVLQPRIIINKVDKNNKQTNKIMNYYFYLQIKIYYTSFPFGINLLFVFNWKLFQIFCTFNILFLKLFFLWLININYLFIFNIWRRNIWSLLSLPSFIFFQFFFKGSNFLS